MHNLDVSWVIVAPLGVRRAIDGGTVPRGARHITRLVYGSSAVARSGNHLTDRAAIRLDRVEVLAVVLG